MIVSSQSVLGLAADAVVLAGLALLGLPALVRIARRRRRSPPTRCSATLTLLSLAAWAAFVATLVHYPQAGGDPIKASYLLFLAPAAAIFGVAYGDRLWHRSHWWRVVLVGWSMLYAISYAGVLVTTY